MTRRPVLTIGALVGVAFVVLMALFRCVSPSPPESPLAQPASPLYLPAVYKSYPCPTCPPCATQVTYPTARPTSYPTPYPSLSPRPTSVPTTSPSTKKGTSGGSCTSDVGGCCERVARLGGWARREWGLDRAGCTNGVTTIWCIWGQNDADKVLARGYIGGESSLVLLFNECDPNGGQCKLDIHDEAVLVHTIVTTFPEYDFATPSFYQASRLALFLAEYERLYGAGSAARDFAYLDMHIYGYSAEYCQQRFAEFIALADEYGFAQVMVSETQIAVEAGNEAYRAQEARLWMNHLEANNRVRYWFWFCAACPETWYEQLWRGRLVDPDTEQLTAFGQAFVEAGRDYTAPTAVAVGVAIAAVAAAGAALWARRKRR